MSSRTHALPKPKRSLFSPLSPAGRPMGVKVQSEDFDVASEVDALASGRTDIGAIVTFTGRVRDDDKGR
ncbi:MAG: molybdenum cofactor biosynthesis protein MoaE, partial [Alphaproteobacteria bacterium]